jgi:cobalt-zinc-cadmium efflux system outer membrane protein
MPDLRHDPDQKGREMRRRIHLALFVSLFLPQPSHGQSTDDLQSTIRQRTGKQVEWQKDVEANDRIREAIRALLRRTLTVDVAVQIALLNNRELQATFEEIGIANADLIEAGLLKNPIFAGDARFPNRSPSGTNVEMSIVQEFFDLLVVPLRKKVAAAQLEKTKLRVGDAVLKLAVEVKTAFYELQAEQQLLGRLKAINETNAAAVELAQRQHEAGNINDLDLANQQATYSQSKLDIAETSASIRSDREKLNRLMGLWGEDTAWKIDDELPSLPPTDFSQQRLESLAINQRLDLAATKTELGAIVGSLGLTKTYRYVGSIEFGVDTEKDTDRQRVTGPTWQLELPIFNHGQGRIAKLEAQLRQVERRLEFQAVAIRAEVREARDRLIAKRDLATYYSDELLPGRKKILELTLTHYNAMLKSPYDLLLAKQNEIAAERGYIDALRDYWIARADLERAVGGSLSSSYSSSKKLGGEEERGRRRGRAGEGD